MQLLWLSRSPIFVLPADNHLIVSLGDLSLGGVAAPPRAFYSCFELAHSSRPSRCLFMQPFPRGRCNRLGEGVPAW